MQIQRKAKAAKAEIERVAAEKKQQLDDAAALAKRFAPLNPQPSSSSS